MRYSWIINNILQGEKMIAFEITSQIVSTKAGTLRSLINVQCTLTNFLK